VRQRAKPPTHSIEVKRNIGKRKSNKISPSLDLKVAALGRHGGYSS